MSLDTDIGFSEDVFGLTFTFASGPGGGGIFDFVNRSGETWTRVDVSTLFPQADLSLFFCHSNSFACEVKKVGDSIIYTFFDGELPSLGRESADGPGHFTINLNTPARSPGDNGGWGAGREFVGVANVPEPGRLALLLMAGGFLAAGFRRRWRRVG
jgi:hypothetical protein